MKKVLIAVAAVLVVIVVVVAAVPFLIDWNRFKPDIAAAVREATGRDLTIDGDIEVSLGTTVSVKVSGVRLANAPGAATAEMLSVGAIEARIELIPLLSSEVIIPTLIVREPAIFLEVDDKGRPNWAFEGSAKPAPAEAAAEGAPINDLRLGEVRIEKGLVSYIDASSGQAIQARDIDISVSLADIASTLSVDAKFSLNDEPVSAKISLESPAKVLAGERFAIAVKLGAKHLTFDLQGGVLQKPVPGFDGSLALDIASVGALAAWLGQPLADDQPDPGPLSVTAELTADGAKAVLKQAVIKGKALDAKASGSVDASGEIMKIVLQIESGVLDIDKYLPPRESAPAAASEAGPSESGPGNPLEALPDTPIDLAPLRQTEADIKIAMAGIRVMGFEVGKVAFGATLKDGVLEADLAELRLYGGTVRGKVRLDGSGEALAATVDVAIDKVQMDALTRAATGEVAVTGVASATVKASASGASPRALARALSGRIALKLGGIDIKNAPAGAISALDLTVSLPGIETSPTVKGFVIYNKERVEIDITVDPLQKILAEDRFALDARIKSRRVNAGYKGTVQHRPLPGLDGDFDLDVPSVGRLAAWLGQPLGKAQPDPGPLKVRASFAADGGKVVLKQATIQGKALEAKASGSYDMSGETAKAVLNLETGVLDIDRYLPPPAAAPAEEPATEPGARGDPLAALPADSLDLSALRQTDADVKIAIGGIKAMGFVVGKVALTVALEGGVLDARLAELRLYGGNISGRVNLDAAAEVLAAVVDIDVAKVDVGKLARAAMGDLAPIAGIADVTLKASAKGNSPRALVENLAAKLSAKLSGVDVKGAPPGITELALDVDLPGLEAPPTVKGTVVYNKEKVVLDLTLDPLRKVLGGERFALKAALASKLVTASYDGTVLQQPVPGLDGALALDVPSVGKLAAWLGQPLPAGQPDPGPLAVRASFAADGAKAVLKEASIEGKAVKASASGSFDGGGKVPVVTARLNVRELDLDAYLPPDKKEKAAAKPTAGAKGPAKGWSKEPFDLSALGLVNADIAVQTGPVKYKGLTIEKSRITVVLRNSVLKAKIEELVLAGGTVGAAVTVDGSKGKLALDYALSIKDVEAQPVLIAFADSDKLSGKMYLETKGRARGGNEFQVVKSLNGSGSIKFLDGAINGINLAETLRSAGSLGFGEKGAAQKTDFAELGGTFTITKGVIDNRDFKMLAPLVRVTGAGKVPMPPRTVDYGVEAKLVATTEGQGGKDSMTGLPIPIRITGSWDNPSYGVDWGSFFGGMDPSRLANLPDTLKGTVEGFGIALPGGEGGLGGALGGILKSIPGFGSDDSGSQPAPTPTTTTTTTTAPAQTQTTQPQSSGDASATETLKGFLNPDTQQGQGDEPAIIKGLKGLFGGD